MQFAPRPLADDTLLKLAPVAHGCHFEHLKASSAGRYSDPLTGLADRRALYNFLDRLVAGGRPFGFLLIDVDHFKDVNDTLGHDAGDALLVEIGRRIQGSVRSQSLVARVGGDEFAVVVSGEVGRRHLEFAAKGIETSLRDDFEFAEHTLDCQVSIGASMFPALGLDRVEVIKQADVALYRAKENGRGRAEFFDVEMLREIDSKALSISHARSALAEDRLEVFYQPKVSLQARRVAGFEALLRVRDDGQIHGPEWIAGAFENSKLSLQIGSRILDQVLNDARAWSEAGYDFGHIAINVTDAELRDPNWAAMILHSISDARLPPWSIEIEVTENVLLSRAVGAVRNSLALLHSRGVKIALDDFGTGYASLTHLREFPVDTIKIDRSFVLNMDEPDSAALVRTVIGLGKSLGMAVVAEGVESESHHDKLAGWDCEYAQGFLYGHPMKSVFFA